MSCDLTRPQSDFFHLDCRYPAFVGGYGCLHGDTKIHTEYGLMRISDILPGVRVLSWDNKNYKRVYVSTISGSFVKGNDYLLEVLTEDGSFIAYKTHLISDVYFNFVRVDHLTDSYKLKKIVHIDLPGLGTLLIRRIQVKNVKKRKVKENYYDMQVPGTNNYICENGFIHHNSGKTQVMLVKAIRDKFLYPDSLIALYEPTYDLARLILIPRLIEFLDKAKVKYMHNKSENVIYLLNRGQFIIRTLDKPGRIIGYEAFRSHVDEIDTLKYNHAKEAWLKIIARNRQKVKQRAVNGIEGKQGTNKVYIYTTPEGFNFVYRRWEKNPRKGHEYIVAPSYSNPYLDPDYIPSLKDQYDDQLVDAYIEGKFVNLTSGSVYRNFNRTLNYSDVVIEDKEPLYVGMDFNVGRGCAVVHVLREGYPIAVDEVVNSMDTPDTIRVLNDRYRRSERTHPITVYPDASSKSRRTTNVSVTDVRLLKYAGYRVKRNSKNPAIKDRVNSMNVMLLNSKGERHYKVNIKKCPFYTDGLEQQVYDKNGLPEKGEGKQDDICFGPDQVVLTDKGHFKFKDMPETGKVLVGKNKWDSYVDAGIRKENQEINEYIFSIFATCCYSITCTPDHLFLKANMLWKQIGKAKKGELFIMDQKNTEAELVTINPKGKSDVHCLTVPGYGYFKLDEYSPIVSNCDAGGYYISYEYPIKKKRVFKNRISGV